MDEKLLNALKKIQEVRKGIPQCLFFSNIMPYEVIQLRSKVIEYKNKYPESEEIDVILHSPGGIADDAYRIIRTLRLNFKTVNIIIPFWAKSAATLLALGGTKIIMDEFGEFGPLDAQISKLREDGPEYDRVSALNDEHSVSIIENRYKIMYEQMFIRLYEHKRINITKTELSNQLLNNLSTFFQPILRQIDPYTLGEKKRILDIGAQYAIRILAQFGSPIDHNSGRKLVDYLIHECPDHGYVIDKSIMENFVTNIESPDYFGKEYEHSLRTLSLLFMQPEDDSAVIEILENNLEEITENEPIFEADKEFVDAINTEEVNNEIKNNEHADITLSAN